MPKPSSNPPPLWGVRALVVLVLGLFCGVAVGILAYLADGEVPAALLAGLMTTGGAIEFLYKALD